MRWTAAVPLWTSLTVLAAAAPAAGRDLPHSRSQPPAQTGCEMFGPGFRKIEGTESCVKIGGQVRVESAYGSGGGAFRSSSH